jgi:hypothetical protein
MVQHTRTGVGHLDIDRKPSVFTRFTSTTRLNRLRATRWTSQDYFRRARVQIDTSWLPWTVLPNGQKFAQFSTRRHLRWFMSWWPTSAASRSRRNCTATEVDTSILRVMTPRISVMDPRSLYSRMGWWTATSRPVKTVEGHPRKVVSTYQMHWDEWILLFLQVYRASTYEITGWMPTSMMLDS